MQLVAQDPRDVRNVSDHPQSSSQYAKYGEEASFPTSGPVGEEKRTDGEGHDKVSLPLLNLWPL